MISDRFKRSIPGAARRCAAWTVLLCLGSVAIQSVRADLVFNGSFEAETANNSGTNIPNGWTPTGNALQFTEGVQSNQFETAQSGDWYATFGNFPPGSASSPNGVSGFEQTIATSAGALYTLSYWYFTNAVADGNEVAVAWDGNVLADHVNVDTNYVWTNETFKVFGTGSDTLAFYGYAHDMNGVDNVTLNPAASAAPLPSTLVMSSILLGMFGTGALCKRRKLSSAAA